MGAREAAFRVLKSEVKIRPIWHWLPGRVEAHVLVAFLGYCLWVCLPRITRPSRRKRPCWRS